MNKVLYFLRDIGFIDEVPTSPPPPRTVLARSVCPLHDGADQNRGFLLYHDGFACMTSSCHKDRRFGSNLIGLLRHMAFRLTGENMPWPAVWNYANRNKAKFTELVADSAKPTKNVPSTRPQISWTRAQLAACLDIPCPYFLSRGFRPETLIHFAIGTCVRALPNGDRTFIGRSIVPIMRRPDLPLLGFTARDPRYEPGLGMAKWQHYVKRSEVLFNEWEALQTRGPIIITEGVPNVLRLYEAGFTGAVATLGSSMSEEQRMLFVAIYANQPVLIAADDDEAGRRFAETTKEKIRGICLHEPVIVMPPVGRKDFGECTVDEVADCLSTRHQECR